MRFQFWKSPAMLTQLHAPPFHLAERSEEHCRAKRRLPRARGLK
jgi:hypothetical protein